MNAIKPQKEKNELEQKIVLLGPFLHIRLLFSALSACSAVNVWDLMTQEG